MRLFVALDLEPAVLHEVEELIAAQRRTAPRARWLSREQLHLTLSFLGEVADEQLSSVRALVAEVARRHASFAVTLDSAGGFPDAARPRVLWLGVGGERRALAALQADLQRALRDFVSTPDDREYHPHLTLARSAHRAGDRELGQCATALHKVALGASQIRELVLYRSQTFSEGVRYTAQLRAALAGAAN